MTLAEAIKAGQAQNKAFRRKRWPEGAYTYHGMDNLVRFGRTADDGAGQLDEPIVPDIATLEADDWELFDGATYHNQRDASLESISSPCE